MFIRPALVVVSIMAFCLAPTAQAGATAIVPTELFAQEPLSAEQFGLSLDVQGDELAVGVPNHFPFEPSVLFGRGGVYIFVRDDRGGWQQAQFLENPIKDTQSHFGMTIDIDDDRMAVGDTGFAEFAGAVHVYRRAADGIWSLEDSLNLDAALGATFGMSLALDGDLLHVGALTTDPGRSFIFRRTASNDWELEAQLTSPTPTTFDWFGTAVALQGDDAFVGSSGGGSPTRFAGAGLVHVFHRQAPGLWTHEAQLAAPDGLPGDGFGADLAVDGDRVVIGAPNSDQQGDAAGAAYVFARDTDGRWNFEQELQPIGLGMFATFGLAVAIQGDIIAGGLPWDSDLAPYAGKVMVFQRQSDGQWPQQPDLARVAPFAYDFLGDSVAIDGTRIVAGGQYACQFVQDDWHGGAFVFDLPGNPADLNGDGVVNGLDLALLLGAWGRCPPLRDHHCEADLDGNGIVNGLDLAILLGAWTGGSERLSA